jgi:hypothetical protein
MWEDIQIVGGDQSISQWQVAWLLPQNQICWKYQQHSFMVKDGQQICVNAFWQHG